MPKEVTCSQPSCQRAVRSQSLCRRHYDEARKSGAITVRRYQHGPKPTNTGYIREWMQSRTGPRLT